MAYDVKDYQVLSMPPRMARKDPSSWYQVEARAAADEVLTVEQARLMLQIMLADPFKLKFHREPWQAPVYAVVVALTWAPREPLTGTDDRPSLFTAVQEQLGLRLEPSTDAVDAFIIDSVEPPSPN